MDDSAIEHFAIPHDPGSQIPVYEGPAEVISGTERYQVQVSTKAVFSPSPKLIATVSGQHGPGRIIRVADSEADPPVTLHVAATSETYGLSENSIHHRIGRKPEYRAEFQLIDQHYKESKVKLTAVVFCLANFPQFWWKTGISHGRMGPIVTTFGEWQLRIEGTDADDKIRSQSERGRSYLITHVCELRRVDGQPFKPTEWATVFEFLYTILGFLSGKRTGPLLAEGRDPDDLLVWRDQLVPRLGHDRHHSHWFPRPYPTDIGRMLSNAWTRWQDPDAREPLQRSVEWYWEAVDREITIETRLILSQVCLELLSWVIMVEEVERVSAGGFKSLPASDRISLLANQLCASQSIPAHFAALSKAASALNWTSVPQSLAEVRNKIIHPEKKGRSVVTELDWEVKYQATEWALWLVELAILWLLEYQGRYDSRIAPPNHAFPFVPWVDPIQAPAGGDAVA